MIRRPLPDLSLSTALSALEGQPFAHFLSGGANARHSWGSSWRIVAAAPAETLTVREGELFRNHELLGPAGEVSPFESLEEMLSRRRRPVEDSMGSGLPPFISGALGHVDYEMAQFLEPSLCLPGAESAGMAFGFYDAVAAWDIPGNEGHVFALSENSADRLEAALTNDIVHNSRISSPPAGLSVESDKSRIQYVADVQHCIEEILAGEIFQANLSRQLSVTRKLEQSVMRWFQEWLGGSASGFASLLQYENRAILSDSPERFFAVEAGGEQRTVIAEPIKGTRRRHPQAEMDQKLAAALVKDEKDRAENIMITDLVRNDLSRVCRDHSVREEKICELRSYTDVHHLVSRVTGTLAPGNSAVDVLASTFPCGSITGAPKIRAMQIIGEIERRRRGIYCGAIGYIDDRGNADFSVAIRTVEMLRQREAVTLTYGTGGGITALSEPAAEFEETTDKAETFFKLIDILDGRTGSHT